MRFRTLLPVAAILLFAVAAEAKIPDTIEHAVMSAYPPALPNRGLSTAYVEPKPDDMRGYVVVEQGGIPAERARWFISWQEYDYRGVVIDVDEKGELTTRRGKPYCYLQRGDVLAVAGIKNFHRTIYLKLLSADVYVPARKKHDKRHSRVTVMLGFDFPKKVLEASDPKPILAEMAKWVKPFASREEAEAYARSIRAGTAPGAPAAPPETQLEREEREAQQEEQVQSLEERIEAQRQELDRLEQEMKALKQEEGKP